MTPKQLQGAFLGVTILMLLSFTAGAMTRGPEIWAYDEKAKRLERDLVRANQVAEERLAKQEAELTELHNAGIDDLQGKLLSLRWESVAK